MHGNYKVHATLYLKQTALLVNHDF